MPIRRTRRRFPPTTNTRAPGATTMSNRRRRLRSLKRKLDGEFCDALERIGGESAPESQQDLQGVVRAQVEILDSSFSADEQFARTGKYKLMETLGLHFSPINVRNLGRRPKSPNNLSGSSIITIVTGQSFSPHKIRHKCRAVPRMQVVEEEYEVKQMRDMAAARKRWEALVRDGKVKLITPREAGYAVQLSNKTLLDVRPSTERKKAWVKGSTWIPIFDVDGGLDVGTLSRKITGFMMGGWWSGIPTLSYNKQFLSKVAEKFPKDTDLIVACQKGLRSLAACEQLHNAGYENIFWVQGGLEAAEDEDLEREGPQPFKLAGIGGLSEFLGWTDQQRAAAAKEGWAYRLVFSARLLGLVLAADALFLGAQKVGHYLQDFRSH